MTTSATYGSAISARSGVLMTTSVGPESFRPGSWGESSWGPIELGAVGGGLQILQIGT